MLTTLAINPISPTPKHLQIVNAIVSGIQHNVIRAGEKLPSLYELCVRLDVSKRTVERAYDHLRQREIIGGVHGKGYYINSSAVKENQKVFLLFNQFSASKKVLYDAFIDQLGLDAADNPIQVDFYTYTNKYRTFEDLLLSHLGGYRHYVIIPPVGNQPEKAACLLNQIPKDRLILLDQGMEGITGEFSSVIQNVKKDLIQSLTEALPLLRKYASLTMLFPPETDYPKDILTGFFAFCSEYGFRPKLVHEVLNIEIQPGNAYICLREEDLVTVVKKTKATPYQAGQQVGIIAYNELPLNEILLDGITALSTDYARMGRMAADLVRSNQRRHVENPCQLITRHSL
ncbi:GntR family transcriptional regulator [Spirosoma aerophilum]